MTRKRFIRLLRGARMTDYHVNAMLACRNIDKRDYAGIIEEIKNSMAMCYTIHGTPLPKELRA